MYLTTDQARIIYQSQRQHKSVLGSAKNCVLGHFWSPSRPRMRTSSHQRRWFQRKHLHHRRRRLVHRSRIRNCYIFRYNWHKTVQGT